MAHDPLEQFSERLSSCLKDRTLLGVTLSSPLGGEIERIKGKPLFLRGSLYLQFESQMSEGRVSQENIAQSELNSYLSRQSEVFHAMTIRHSGGGTAQLLISKKGKRTYTEDKKLRESLRNTALTSALESAWHNNRTKNRLLNGQETFLQALGISDASGRVHDKKQSKFRQICRFCELVEGVMENLPKNGPVHVCDLCSGKSYLSFAVYYVLHVLHAREVHMTCIDLKDSVMKECQQIADSIGFTGMRFLTMNIDDYSPSSAPDLVISLHACDIATDIVLNLAAKVRSAVILSTPCCHRDLKNHMHCEDLSFVTQYGILADKLCTALTDALRLKRLNVFGYDTSALELIDPEDTPKNVMLRSVMSYDPRVFREKTDRLAGEYRELYSRLTGQSDERFENTLLEILKAE